jgi:hypothetical protein
MPTIVVCDLPGSNPDKPLTCVARMPCCLDRSQVEVFLEATKYNCWEIVPGQDVMYRDFCSSGQQILVRIPAHHKSAFMHKYDEYFRGGASSAVSANN